MIEIKDQNLDTITKAIEETDSPYYGGSVAYLTLLCNLSFLKKLILIREKKDPAKYKTYYIIRLLCDDLMAAAKEAVNEDPIIFKVVMDKTREDKDEYIHNVVLKQKAFLSNLLNLKSYVAFLATDLKGAIVEDFRYLIQVLRVVYDCLENNIKFEISRIKDDLKRVELQNIVMSN